MVSGDVMATLLYLQVTGPEEFLRLLGCQQSAKVKVVSIFGNTGDGKSHTLNHAFFQGREVWPLVLALYNTYSHMCVLLPAGVRNIATAGLVHSGCVGLPLSSAQGHRVGHRGAAGSVSQ